MPDSRQQRFFTGQEFGPLPYESTLSVMMRVAWLNSLKINTIQEIFAVKNLSKEYSFYKLRSLKDAGCLKKVGWVIPATGETHFYEMLAKLEPFLMSETFRICPICAQAAFHSYWHQFSLLKVCPLHNVKLVSNCLECGKRLPRYEFNRKILDSPWECLECEKNFFGAPVRIENHEDLRSQYRWIDEQFSKCEFWLSERCQTLNILRAVHGELRGDISALSVWCRPDIFMRDVLINGSELVDARFARTHSETTILIWEFNVEGTGIDLSTEFVKPKLCLGVIREEYRQFVKFMRRWLVMDAYLDKCEINKPIETRDKKMASHGHSSYVLAYHLLRAALENYSITSINEDIFCNTIRADHIAATYNFDGRVCRQAVRAILFGFYAVMYWFVEKSRGADGFIDLRDIRVPADTLVARTLKLESKQILSGVVIFPTIAKLPIEEFAEYR